MGQQERMSFSIMRQPRVITGSMLALLLWAMLCTRPTQGAEEGGLGSSFAFPGTGHVLPGGTQHRGLVGMEKGGRGRSSLYERSLRGPSAISRGAVQQYRKVHIQQRGSKDPASRNGGHLDSHSGHGTPLGPGTTSARRVLTWRLHPPRHERSDGGLKGRHSYFACDCPLLRSREQGGKGGKHRRKKGDRKGKRRRRRRGEKGGVKGRRKKRHGFRGSAGPLKRQYGMHSMEGVRRRHLLAVGSNTTDVAGLGERGRVLWANTTNLGALGQKGRILWASTTNSGATGITGRSLWANEKGCKPPPKGHHSPRHQRKHKKQCKPRSRRELAREAIAALVRQGYTETAKYLKQSRVLLRLKRPGTFLAPANEAYCKGNVPEYYSRQFIKHPKGGPLSGRLMAYHTLTRFQSYRQLMGHVPTVYQTSLPRSFVKSFRKREYCNSESSHHNRRRLLWEPETDQYSRHSSGHKGYPSRDREREYYNSDTDSEGYEGRLLWNDRKSFRNVLGFRSLQGNQGRTTVVKHKNLFCNALVIIQGVNCLLLPPRPSYPPPRPHYKPPRPSQKSPPKPISYSPPRRAPYPPPEPVSSSPPPRPRRRPPPPASPGKKPVQPLQPPPPPQTPTPAPGSAPVPVAFGPTVPSVAPESLPIPGPRSASPPQVQPESVPSPSAPRPPSAPQLAPESLPIPYPTVTPSSPTVTPPSVAPEAVPGEGPAAPLGPYIPQYAPFPSAPPFDAPPEVAPESPLEPSGAPQVPGEVVPMEAPSEGTPTEAPSEGAPTEAPSEGAPTEAPSEGAPTEAPSEGAPIEAPSEGAPTEAPSEGAPIEAPSEGAPTEAPSEGAPIEAPSEAVPIEIPSEGAPFEAPSEGAPFEAPSESPAGASPAA